MCLDEEMGDAVSGTYDADVAMACGCGRAVALRATYSSGRSANVALRLTTLAAPVVRIGAWHVKSIVGLAAGETAWRPTRTWPARSPS
jgi:hypothetical protein